MYIGLVNNNITRSIRKVVNTMVKSVRKLSK